MNDANPAVLVTETIDYRVAGSTLYTMEFNDNNVEYEKPIPLIGSTSVSVSFDEGKGNTMTFYFTQAEADKIPSTDCGGDDGMQTVPANDILSGTVDFNEFDTAGISTENAWIRITPTVFENNNDGWNGLQCEIMSDGSFGTNCVIHWDEAGLRDAFAAEGAIFSYGIFRDSNLDKMWQCEEDYLDGNGDLSLADITDSPLIAIADHYRAGTPCN